MPYAWVDPELVLNYKGIRIYNTYKNDDMACGAYEFWFTQHMDSANQFDIRNFDCYDANLSTEDNLRRAIDAGEVVKEED